MSTLIPNTLSRELILKWAKEAQSLLKKGTSESLAGVKTNLSMIIAQAKEAKEAKEAKILKFGDMPYGTIFHEHGALGNPRRFIKVQDFLPSGLKSINYRRAVGAIGDKEYKEEDQPLLPFNSIDLDTGCTANCPDWLEFVVDKLGKFSSHIEDRRNPMAVEPIKPSQVVKKKKDVIPDYVIESFNELIVKHFDGSSSIIKQDEVVSLILSKMPEGSKQQDIFNNKWLNVEDVFRKAGWEIDYDKPGYNETYPATFEFKPKRMRQLP